MRHQSHSRYTYIYCCYVIKSIRSRSNLKKKQIGMIDEPARYHEFLSNDQAITGFEGRLSSDSWDGGATWIFATRKKHDRAIKVWIYSNKPWYGGKKGSERGNRKGKYGAENRSCYRDFKAVDDDADDDYEGGNGAEERSSGRVRIKGLPGCMAWEVKKVRRRAVGGRGKEVAEELG